FVVLIQNVQGTFGHGRQVWHVGVEGVALNFIGTGVVTVLLQGGCSLCQAEGLFWQVFTVCPGFEIVSGFAVFPVGLAVTQTVQVVFGNMVVVRVGTLFAVVVPFWVASTHDDVEVF